MGHARFGAYPAGCGAGARAEASGCRGSVGKIVSIETMTTKGFSDNLRLGRFGRTAGLSANLLAFFLMAGGLPAQTFIQMSDPQFGMFTKDQDFAHETLNFDFAIATANRLQPAFVVVTGDLINKGGDATQAAEYKRIAAKLKPGIRLYSVPGNHDVGNEPTPESLALYRERFGRDYYTFRVGDIAGFVLNSNLEKG